MTLPPPTGPARPAPPPLRLPVPRRRPGGLIVSALLHGIILLFITRYGVQLVLGGGDDPFGARGGGGGAGGSVRFVDLPAAAAPAPAPAPKAEVVQPPVHVVPPPQLDPAPTLTQSTIAPPAVVSSTTAAVSANGDGSAGQGPGTGGGTGSGTGTGAGNDSGPGRGGNGGYILPSTRVLIFPPDCAHGRFRVQFSISAEGRVTRVGVDPEPQDAECRRQMLDKMKRYEFSPATRDGRAVATTYEVTVQH